jgi:hypothetical protein
MPTIRETMSRALNRRIGTVSPISRRLIVTSRRVAGTSGNHLRVRKDPKLCRKILKTQRPKEKRKEREREGV